MPLQTPHNPSLRRVILRDLSLAYLTWSAVSGEPNSFGCNKLSSIEGSQQTAVYVGVALMFVAIFWVIIRVGTCLCDGLQTYCCIRAC